MQAEAFNWFERGISSINNKEQPPVKMQVLLYVRLSSLTVN